MNDHSHYEYADDRHDHDLDYAEKHHRHYDDESTARGLREDLGRAEERIRELEDGLRDALNRIHVLEDLQPDYAGPEAAVHEPDERLSHTPGDTRPCRSPQAHGYSAVALSGTVQCDVPQHHAPPPDTGEELSPVLCTRVIMTGNGPRQCRLPVDHEPDAACPGNPHARTAPAPEASQQLAPCGCPKKDGMIRHQRSSCTDPIAARLDWYADDGGRP